MSEYAAHEEAALEEEARLRLDQIRESEDASAHAAAADTSKPSPDEEIAQVRRSGRQHDHTDTAGYDSVRRGRRGPAR